VVEVVEVETPNFLAGGNIVSGRVLFFDDSTIRFLAFSLEASFCLFLSLSSFY